MYALDLIVGVPGTVFPGSKAAEISDNEIYLLIKYIKIVLWRVVKRLSYIEDARCLKVNDERNYIATITHAFVKCKSSPVTGLQWPRGFQEVKVPRFHDNGTGRW